MKSGLAIATFLSTSLMMMGAAHAEIIFLTCTGDNPTQLTVDLTKSTVNNMPATINPTSIDWQHVAAPASDGTTGTTYGHIDRSAGTYTSWATFHTPSGQDLSSGQTTMSCIAGSPPPTKF
jgi:hypothetical protein